VSSRSHASFIGRLHGKFLESISRNTSKEKRFLYGESCSTTTSALSSAIQSRKTSIARSRKNSRFGMELSLPGFHKRLMDRLSIRLSDRNKSDRNNRSKSRSFASKTTLIELQKPSVENTLSDQEGITVEYNTEMKRITEESIHVGDVCDTEIRCSEENNVAYNECIVPPITAKNGVDNDAEITKEYFTILDGIVPTTDIPEDNNINKESKKTSDDEAVAHPPVVKCSRKFCRRSLLIYSTDNNECDHYESQHPHVVVMKKIDGLIFQTEQVHVPIKPSTSLEYWNKSRNKTNVTFCNNRFMGGVDYWAFFGTFLLIITGTVLSTIPNIVNKSISHVIILFILFIVTMYCLIKVYFTDPGYIPKSYLKYNTLFKEISKCSYCEVCCIWRDNSTHHCSKCDACVVGFDHHCPWLGTCIGRRNYNYYLYFLMTLLVLIVFNIITSGIKGIQYIYKIKNEISYDMSENINMVCILYNLFAFPFIFGLQIYHCRLINNGQTTFQKVTNQTKETNKKDGFINNFKKSYFPQVMLPSLIIK